ncbi:IstB-like ATP binding protein [Ruminococcaceae bacterium FB2012]|nr:IstB-like ATP binding protein [Ruminococcaceae bacterium FB2012]
MLSEETRRKLREMNLGELVEAIDLQEKQPEYMALSFDDRINLAVDYTYSAKYNAKVHRLISAARFRIADAALVNVYYEKRGLDKDMILTLGNCGFIEKNQPVVFNGFTGSGKSYLACAIGRQACMHGFRTRYIRVPDLMQLLSEASLDVHGRSKLLKKFSGYRLLILDEWLLNDMTESEQHFIFELIERRYSRLG